MMSNSILDNQLTQISDPTTEIQPTTSSSISSSWNWFADTAVQPVRAPGTSNEDWFKQQQATAIEQQTLDRNSILGAGGKLDQIAKPVSTVVGLASQIGTLALGFKQLEAVERQTAIMEEKHRAAMEELAFMRRTRSEITKSYKSGK